MATIKIIFLGGSTVCNSLWDHCSNRLFLSGEANKASYRPVRSILDD